MIFIEFTDKNKEQNNYEKSKIVFLFIFALFF